MQSSQAKLNQATVELQKQKELNEKLEVDLLSINNDNDRPTTDTDHDVLAGLDIGKKVVNTIASYDLFCGNYGLWILFRTPPFAQPLYLSLHQQIHLSYPS